MMFNSPFRLFHLLTFCILALFTTATMAEQKEDMGEYVLHYNAFASTFLTPKIAQQYKIMRSRSIGIINLALIKKPDTAVGALVQGTFTNNVQQQQTLSFTQIVEGKSIYYIAQVPFSEGELLTFDITLMPNGAKQPLQFQFSQNFYN